MVRHLVPHHLHARPNSKIEHTTDARRHAPPHQYTHPPGASAAWLPETRLPPCFLDQQIESNTNWNQPIGAWCSSPASLVPRMSDTSHSPTLQLPPTAIHPYPLVYIPSPPVIPLAT